MLSYIPTSVQFKGSTFLSSTSAPIWVLPMARRASSRDYERLTFRGKLLTQMRHYVVILFIIWKLLALSPRQHLNECDFRQKSITSFTFPRLGPPRSQWYLHFIPRLALHTFQKSIDIFSKSWVYTFSKVLCYRLTLPQGLFLFPQNDA